MMETIYLIIVITANVVVIGGIIHMCYMSYVNRKDHKHWMEKQKLLSEQHSNEIDELVQENEKLVGRYNKLVGEYNKTTDAYNRVIDNIPNSKKEKVIYDSRGNGKPLTSFEAYLKILEGIDKNMEDEATEYDYEKEENTNNEIKRKN